MKLKKAILLSLGMILCVGGAVGTALALETSSATVTGSGSFDKVIYLYWGAEETSKPASLGDLDKFENGVPQYTFLSVVPSASASVTGSVEVTFALAADEGKSIDGLTVEVYKTPTLFTASDVGNLPESPAHTLDESNPSGTDRWNVSPSAKAFYAFKVTYVFPSTPSTLGGIVTISQQYSTSIIS